MFFSKTNSCFALRLPKYQIYHTRDTYFDVKCHDEFKFRIIEPDKTLLALSEAKK